MPLYGGGGGGAAVQTVRQVYITAGNITLGSDAGWTLETATEVDLPAAAGDRVEFYIGGMWQKGSGDFLDLAVVVGTTAVRFHSTNTGTPGGEGDPELYPDTGFVHMLAPFSFVVTSGDLDGGNVRVMVAHKGTPGGGTVYASSTYPLQMYAVNKHTVS